MKRLLIIGAALAMFAVPATASASTRPCGKTTSGWRVKAGENTSCKYAWKTARRVRSYQKDAGIYQGDRFPVWPDWRELSCHIPAGSTTLGCHGFGRHVIFRVTLKPLR